MAKLTAAATAVPFLLLCCFAAIAAGQKRRFQVQYASFKLPFYDELEIVWPATVNQEALQITPDSAQDLYKFSQSGRILLKERFKLWDGGDAIGSANATARLASFNTSFLINIYRRADSDAGEGLAFVIAPDANVPANSSGEYLGLANTSTNTRPENKFIAVEFDTFKQSYDPDNNHVGIDVNGVRSVKNESLTPHNITLVSGGDQPKFFNVWIDYDGVARTLDVYIVEQPGKNDSTPPKPRTPILSHNISLMDYVKQYSYLGFSAATGANATQLNCVLRWNLTVHSFGEDQTNWLKVGLGAGIPALFLMLGLVAWVAYYCHRRKVAKSNPEMIQALKSLPGTPREYEFKDLKKATNSFNDGNKLGEGGYGVVYRGVVPKEGTAIAVKCFSRESIKGQDDFLAELTIINRLRHKHLVKLLGWCHKNGKLLLVYEYMPKGSLDQHLFVGANVEPLSWGLRYKIITGVASALHYLHNEYDQRVVHRDIKASNIMLDSNFNARLGDFGLARALENEKTSYAEAEGVLGTMGYIAPECFHTGKATQYSDIYAFGAVLLEVVCGQRPGAKISGFHSLVDWVWYMHRDGRLINVVDKRLGDDYVVEEAQRLILLGLACSHPTASERPKTQAILQMISGTVPVPNVPPFKPAFVWPSGGPMDSELNTGDTMSMSSTSHFGSGWSPQCLSRESPTPNNDSLV